MMSNMTSGMALACVAGAIIFLQFFLMGVFSDIASSVLLVAVSYAIGRYSK